MHQVVYNKNEETKKRYRRVMYTVTLTQHDTIKYTKPTIKRTAPDQAQPQPDLQTHVSRMHHHRQTQIQLFQRRNQRRVLLPVCLADRHLRTVNLERLQRAT